MKKYIAKHIGLSPKLLISAAREAREARAARAAPGTSRPPQGPQGHETSPGYFLAALGISAPAAENEQKTLFVASKCCNPISSSDGLCTQHISTQPESHITSPSIVKQIAAEMDLTAETPAGPSPECYQSHWQIPTAFGQWLESSSAVLKGQAPN